MSEKGKEIEEGNEREMFHHWSHEHPLTLVKTREKIYCYGCKKVFSIGEQAYGCSTEGCDYSWLLHEECAAMAREIRHPLHHPQHILILRHEGSLISCCICGRTIWSIGYKCSVCYFQMHMRCAQGGCMVDATGNDDKRRNIIHHLSHPEHKLKLWRRRCTFKCDACCTTSKGSSYACTNDVCEYWIYETCASLPFNLQKGRPPSLPLFILSRAFWISQFQLQMWCVQHIFAAQLLDISLPNQQIYCPRQLRFQQAASHHWVCFISMSLLIKIILPLS